MNVKFLFLFLLFLLSNIKKCAKEKKEIHPDNSTHYIADGYMNKFSYSPGDTALIFINSAWASAENVKLYVYDVNHFIVDSLIVSLYPQTIKNTYPWKDGFGYSPSFGYVIPYGLKSGMYNWENKIFFIVKHETKNADITIIYPSNTETAYNYSGGKSLYNFSSSNHTMSTAVSFQRPYVTTHYKLFADGIMEWLNTLHGYSVQYVCDQDMDDYNEIKNTKIIVVIGHSEYWTRNARLNFDQFVDSGHDAIILSGNTMWWQARYSKDKTQLICYKGSLYDSISDPLLTTVNWSDTLLHYPILNSIGADCIHGVDNNFSFLGWKGYKIMSPNSPLLMGTNLNYNDILSCPTQESDGTLISGFDSQNNPFIDTSSLGFCKMELIGYDWGQNPVIATDKGYGTFIAFKKSPFSGNVINTASNHWCYKEGDTLHSQQGGFVGVDANKIKQITLNMFNLLLAHNNIYSTSAIPGCLTTQEYIASSEKEFIISPSPTTGIINLQFVSSQTNTWSISKDIKIDVYNSMGQKIYSQNLDSQITTEIDLTNHLNGIYLLRVILENKTEYRKIIKQ